MITKFTIYGERCSGTNYLENIILANFDINVTWEYGWKHFFGFNNLSNSDDTLFICIVRDPYLWLNSLYKTPHHLSSTLINNIDNFLSNEFFSFYGNIDGKIDESNEIINDRNIYTQKRYKNIFEMRYTKLKYMTEDLPSKVKNYMFIRYEDLLDDFENTIMRIKNCGLKLKENIIFPINIKTYKKENKLFIVDDQHPISIEKIYNNDDYDNVIEEMIGYKSV